MDNSTQNKTFSIKCDHCEGLFDPKESILDKVKLIGITVDIMKCPLCGYAYPIKYTDKHQKLFDEQIAGYTQMIAQRKRLGKSVSPARLRKLKSLLESSKAYQLELRNKYFKAVTTQLNSGEIETNSITGKEESHEE